MNTIPIAFAFDNNLVMPACVCLSSLMMNAKPDTFYDIFILHSEKENLRKEELNQLPKHYPNCRIQYRTVGDVFDQAFEIRGITTPAYYRLLIPEIIPEYDKIIYSDVDVIFRDDLSAIFHNTDLSNCYLGGVDSLSDLQPHLCEYYNKLGITAKGIIYSGNLIINSKKLKEDGIVARFKALSQNNYIYQDMDVLNLVCRGKINYMPMEFCLTTYLNDYAVHDTSVLSPYWSDAEIENAMTKGIVHYNGQKPWKGFCPNFDIWWEYYRKSPYFDEKFYFEFFYSKLNELDQLSLLKRIKILARYFIHGRA